MTIRAGLAAEQFADLPRARELAGTAYDPEVLDRLYASVPPVWRAERFLSDQPPLQGLVRSTRARQLSLARLTPTALRETQWVFWHWDEHGRRLIALETLTALFRAMEEVNRQRVARGRPALQSLVEFDLDEVARARGQEFQRRHGRLPSAATTHQARRSLADLQAPLLMRYSARSWWEHDIWRPDEDPRIPVAAASPYRHRTLNLGTMGPPWLRHLLRLYLRDSLSRNGLSWTTAFTYCELISSRLAPWIAAHDTHGPLLVGSGAELRGYTNRLIADLRGTPKPDGTLPGIDGLRRQQTLLQAMFTYAYDNAHELADTNRDNRWLALYPEHLRLWAPSAIVLNKARDTADERAYLPDSDLAQLLQDIDVIAMARTETKTVLVDGHPTVVQGLARPQTMRAWLLQQLCGRRASEIMLLTFNPLEQSSLHPRPGPGHEPGIAATTAGAAVEPMAVKLRYGQVKIHGVDTSIFVGQDVVQIVKEQQAWVRAHLKLTPEHPDPPWLFIKTIRNVNGGQFWNACSYHSSLRELDHVLRKTDSSGRPLRYSVTHRLRHTKATDLLNAGAPIHVVQRYLGQKTPTMTMRYARTLDSTAEREFLRTQKIRRGGEPLGIEPSDLYDMLHLDRRTDRVLPTGYCLLPPVKTCDKGNACYGCDEYATDASYLQDHREQLARTLELIDIRQHRFIERTGAPMSVDNVWLRERLIETASLQAIITALEARAPEAACPPEGRTRVRGAGSGGRAAVLLDTSDDTSRRFHADRGPAPTAGGPVQPPTDIDRAVTGGERSGPHA